MQGLRLGIPDPVDDFLEARRKNVQLLVRFRAHWGTWAVRVHAVLDVQVRVGAWRMTKEEAEEAFEKTKVNDHRKNEWAKANGYKMIRIRHDESVSTILTAHFL